MNKESIQANINKMKLEIADMEAKLEESDKVVLGYKYNNCYAVNMNYTYCSDGNSKEYLKHARYRDTEAQAEEALLRELQANRIEALARKLDADWKADWLDRGITKQKYFIELHTTTGEYLVGVTSILNKIGTPYMSKQTAETICDYLNSGRYSLDMED